MYKRANKCSEKRFSKGCTEELVCSNFNTCKQVYFAENETNGYCEQFEMKPIEIWVHEEKPKEEPK